MNTQEPSTKTIWLLSPYHTGSHASWANGYQTNSRHRVELLTMAGRFWKWRMQGGAIEVAQQIRSRLHTGEQPDLLLATDMVNVASLMGLLHPEIASGRLEAPFILYMHENQLTYPWRPGEKPDFTYAMINWLSQLCADQVLFNSRYHLESWFSALPNLLKHFPDYNHLKLVDEVRAKSQVAPVGIACDRILADSARRITQEDAPSLPEVPNSCRAVQEPPLILWNQRWEYDKRPDLFFQLLYQLDEAGVPFRLAVAGENFRKVPQEFEEAQARLANQTVHWGYVDSYAGYVELLQRSDLVISTAIHEFFGISVLEAIVAGAFPLLPNRLSYPELIPTELHPACLYEDEDDLFEKARHRLLTPRTAPPSLQNYVLDGFAWASVAENYDQMVDEQLLYRFL